MIDHRDEFSCGTGLHVSLAGHAGEHNDSHRAIPRVFDDGGGDDDGV